MRLLLDTHVVLWWLSDSPILSENAISLIERASDVFVSAVSVWEVAIKRALGKLDAPADLPGAVEASGFSQLWIRFEHASTAGTLPRHHDDPFDRMLIAQAQYERLTLMTSDRRVSEYAVATFPAS